MPSLTITLVQTALHWEDKAANLAMLENKIQSITEPAEVVVLPEMFSTGFSMQPAALAETMNGPAVAWMSKIAASKRIILTGSLIIEEAGHYYNRLIWMLPNGSYGFYDKRHLFAFAGEHLQYTPGARRLITAVKGWKLNMQVCYDLRFPVWARQQLSDDGTGTATAPEYDVLVYAANWPARRSLAWITLLQARAIENQCYVIGVNRVGTDGNGIIYNGNSMVINPAGEILYQADAEEAIFTITLQASAIADTRNQWPFLKDADKFLIKYES